MSGPKKTPTQELAALGGPVHLIDVYENKLIARLAEVLERRNSIRHYLGSTDEQAEAEIHRLCSTFARDVRAEIRQLISEAYTYNRFVKVAKKLDIPADTWDEIPDIEIVLKDTLSFGKIPYPPKPVVSEPPKGVEAELGDGEVEDFTDLFVDEKK